MLQEEELRLQIIFASLSTLIIQVQRQGINQVILQRTKRCCRTAKAIWYASKVHVDAENLYFYFLFHEDAINSLRCIDKIKIKKSHVPTLFTLRRLFCAVQHFFSNYTAMIFQWQIAMGVENKSSEYRRESGKKFSFEKISTVTA